MDWKMSGVVRASLGEPQWLPFMLTPLDKKLAEIFMDQSTPGTPLRDRKRYVQALFALADFMHHAGFARGTIDNFNELGLALWELERGTVRHFLTPKKSRNRPIDPGDIWLARAHVAAALDLAVRDGETAQTASEHIEKAFGFMQPILSPTSDDFAGTVRKWRADFLGEKIMDRRSSRVFSERHFLEQHARLTILSKGEQIVPGAVAAQILYDAGIIATRAANKSAIERALAGPKRGRKRLIRKRKV